MSHKIQPIKADVPWLFLVLSLRRREPSAGGRLIPSDERWCGWPANGSRYGVTP